MNKCIQSNTIGSNAVFNFCLKHKIKLIYSATSASLGNGGEDKNLSPYAFTKSKNLELLENLKKWFKFRYEVIFFYNVYGPKQIKTGDMATVIGIFENLYLKKKPLPVVKPGTQSRRFTHIDDTVKVCYMAYKKNNNCHYSIASNKSYKIIDLAKQFGGKIKYVPHRKGERFESKIINMIRGKKIINIKSKSSIKEYIQEFKKMLNN